MRTNIAAYMLETTGLVPMRITIPGGFTPYPENSIYGFPPDVAEDYFLRRIARPVRPGEVDEPDVEVEQPQAEVLPPVNLTPIPDEWEKMHTLQLSKLAKEIAATTRKIDREEALEIVQRELERRRSIQ